MAAVLKSKLIKLIKLCSLCTLGAYLVRSASLARICKTGDGSLSDFYVLTGKTKNRPLSYCLTVLHIIAMVAAQLYRFRQSDMIRNPFYYAVIVI